MKKKTQKLIGLVMAVAVVASMLAGCSQKLSGTVATDGSTSMEKVIGALVAIGGIIIFKHSR